MGDSQYSFSLTTFSHSGKLVQIKHALTAVGSGQTSLGIKEHKTNHHLSCWRLVQFNRSCAMGQSYSFPKSLVEHSPREILTSRRFSFKPVTVVSSLDDEDYEFHREVTQGRDYTSYLPNELLASIFHFLGAGDRKRSSPVYHRWLRVDDQSRHCLSLNAQAGLLPFLPTLFARFDSVTKLALQCDHKSISLDDYALVLWVFEIRKLIRHGSKRGALLVLRTTVGGRIMGWNVTETNPCSWLGVKCESDRVTELQLPGWALVGQLPLGLKNLTQLLTFSLCINALSCPLPNDLVNLVNLKNLYLQGNSFSGPIPEFLFKLKSLMRLNLEKNKFFGEISSAFNNLTSLVSLHLEVNQLTGSIPELGLPISLCLHWAVLAARKNEHLLLEKPTALDVSELDQILEAFESKRCTVHGWQHVAASSQDCQVERLGL